MGGRGWSWRVEERGLNPGLGLRYEPGGWGDVLKGAWAVGAALGLTATRAEAGSGFLVLDVYAGAPEYPLVPASAARLERARRVAADGGALAAWIGAAWRPGPGEAGASRPGPEAEGGRLASTGAAVVRSLARVGAGPGGPGARLRVAEADPGRRAAWTSQPGVEVVAASGPEALARAASDSGEGADAVDLAIVDPYDLLADWSALREATGALARRAPTLLYVYNRAPRGARAFDDYRAWRRDLTALTGADARVLVGRVPTDAVLPRASHEVVLVGPAAVVDPLAPALALAARALALDLAADGAFEAEGA